MANILCLDQETINKIAAGEVVDRPSSIVKELMENAIDAGSSSITVEIKDGGTSFIRITDNGCGIEKDDIRVAFLRHSTSKIKNVKDLLSISTLGFRGEALSSIGAVAMVELITKTKKDMTGIRYVFEGGVEKSFEEVGVPDGTTFIVRNLFYNTPARKKFMKSNTTEGAYINDIVERIALSNPHISIKFISNGQNKLHTNGNGNLKDVIYAIYGKDITSNLLEISSENEFLKITGFIGKPVISRGNRNYETYFINGRYIKSSIISKGIENGYGNFLMQHKYPFTVLNIEIEPELLDVNVHPSKMEVRFGRQNEVFEFVMKSVNETISKKDIIPKVSFSTEREVKLDVEASRKKQLAELKKASIPEPFEKVRIEKQVEKPVEKPVEQKQVVEERIVVKPQLTIKQQPVINSKPVVKEQFTEENNHVITKSEIKKLQINKSEVAIEDVKFESEVVEKIVSEEPNYVVEESSDKKDETDAEENLVTKEETPVEESYSGEQMTLFEDKFLAKENKDRIEIVGQIFNTYWIVQFNDNMFIIDQHAAHEKVLYEKTLKRMQNGEGYTQMIAPPIILSLSQREADMMEQHMDLFTKMGYEIEHFGDKDYAVRGVPGHLFSISKSELLMEIIDGIADDNAHGFTSNMIDEKIASMSCKAAVKGNNRLSMAEAKELIMELMTLDNPYNCPHGRPTIISMSKYELEKKFKRIV